MKLETVKKGDVTWKVLTLSGGRVITQSRVGQVWSIPKLSEEVKPGLWAERPLTMQEKNEWEGEVQDGIFKRVGGQ